MYVPIEFDKPRRLRFDIAAVRDLEAALNGQPLGAIIHQIQSFGVTAICAALWAGLKHEDKALNPNLVMKMLERHLQKEGTTMSPIVTALADAIDACGLFKTPKLEEEQPAEGNAGAERAPSPA